MASIVEEEKANHFDPVPRSPLNYEESIKFNSSFGSLGSRIASRNTRSRGHFLELMNCIAEIFDLDNDGNSSQISNYALGQRIAVEFERFRTIGKGASSTQPVENFYDLFKFLRDASVHRFERNVPNGVYSPLTRVSNFESRYEGGYDILRDDVFFRLGDGEVWLRRDIFPFLDAVECMI